MKPALDYKVYGHECVFGRLLFFPLKYTTERMEMMISAVLSQPNVNGISWDNQETCLLSKFFVLAKFQRPVLDNGIIRTSPEKGHKNSLQWKKLGN